MQRATSGDAEAFDVLRARYDSFVHAYLLHALGATAADLDEVAREVFECALKFAPAYRYPQKVSTWLFTIARNVTIKSGRRAKSADTFADDDVARVLGALDGLPDSQREAVVRAAFPELSQARLEELLRRGGGSR